MDLKALKVKISLKDDGGAKYPDFNQMEPAKRGNSDWSQYIDSQGSGWLYDSVGHKDVEARVDEWDSPHGQQWGVILVPQVFADEAVSLFPSECKIIDETKLEKFYDDYHAKDFADEVVDEEALKVFDVKEKYKVALTPEEEAKKTKALDPNDDTAGIKKNHNKKWADFKVKKGYNIV